jgi:hypothetical protein
MLSRRSWKGVSAERCQLSSPENSSSMKDRLSLSPHVDLLGLFGEADNNEGDRLGVGLFGPVAPRMMEAPARMCEEFREL